MQPDEANAGGCERQGFDPDLLLSGLQESADEVFETMLCGAVQSVVQLGAPQRVDENNMISHVDVEATVRFTGDCNGSVVLRCSADGAVDITRGLLMMDDDETIDLDEIKDAIGECANMMGGAMKANILDPRGEFTLSVPEVEAFVNREAHSYCGSLAYQLKQGSVALEVWVDHATVGGPRSSGAEKSQGPG